ncbi:MAG: FMN-binding negative transcriptional regulator [Bacteroidota bacterium]
MDYPPRHYLSVNKELLVATAEAYPLAALSSIWGEKHAITHLPLVYYPDDGVEQEHFIGHFDARNPQVESIGQSMTAVFTGPSLYISPNDYEKQKGRLPTYNFIRLHLTGQTERINDEARVMQSLVELTEYLERTDTQWELATDNMVAQKLLPYIVAFRFIPTSWTGRFKLSQDKSVHERQRTFDKLKSMHREPTPGYWHLLRQELFEQ